MKHLISKFLVCMSFIFVIFKSNAEKIHQEIQDVIINNQIVQKGLTNCKQHYDEIKLILNKYKRPITVLDLGAGQGYFSFSIAHDYDSTCVMNESNDEKFKWADQLLELCHLNSGLKNIILLNTKMTLQELEKLADCEHFDVILAFDYINYKNEQWEKFLDAVLRLGDNIFIKISHSKTQSKNKAHESFKTCLQNNGGSVILQTPNSYNPEVEEQLFWFKRNKDKLLCKSFTNDKDKNRHSFSIKSTYSKKMLIKNGKISGSQWKHGINLETFLMLNGVYPTKEKIKQAVAKLTKQKLTDFVPKNLIVQGYNIELIDQNDECYREANVAKSLEFINEVIDQPTPAQVAQLLAQISSRHKRKHVRSWIFRLLTL